MRVKSAMNSLGILEVQGLVASIEGLDAMLKAAAGAAYTYGEAARRAACDDCCGGERGGCDSRSRGGRGVCGRAWQGVRLRSHCAGRTRNCSNSLIWTRLKRRRGA